MNERWDLTSLYTGFDAPEYGADMEKAAQTVRSLESFAASLPRQDVAAALEEALKLEEQPLSSGQWMK